MKVDICSHRHTFVSCLLFRAAQIARADRDRTLRNETARYVIVPSPGPSQTEKAQIAVDGAEHGYRDLRIENALTDEDGNDVRLKKGTHVEG